MAQGYWDRVLALLKPGDIVIMQFGHNDNGPTAPLSGTGEETEDRAGAGGSAGASAVGGTAGKHETVHTWGWYMRKYVADARAKGAVPVMCTLIPRNIRENERSARDTDSHADWARAVAKSEQVPLLDLNELIAQRYDPLGETAVTALFADKRVHTTREGAVLNAEIVVSALASLPKNPAGPYLRAKPAPVW